MADRYGGTFSVPYEIAAVRPLRQTSSSEREEALRAAHYNTELLPQELIYVDLSTDSGVSSLSTNQLAILAGAKSTEPGMGLAAEGSRAFARLADAVKAVFGFPFVIPTTQGRAGERLWAKLTVKSGNAVAGNMLFPSTRTHLQMNGAEVVDVIGDVAHDLKSDDPFKGNLDLEKLRAIIAQHGADKVSCIYVELGVNGCGGQPVALANLKAVRTIAAANRIPIFLDACRILENSFLIKERESGYQNRTVLDIVRETCAQADGCTMSALKDFLVASGGLIMTRDEALYRQAAMQCFLDGAQLGGGAMDLLTAAIEDIFAAEAHVARRVGQVQYLWRRLNGNLPLVHPAGGHGVFIDTKEFLQHLKPEDHPTEALAAFVYRIAGVRLTKGAPPVPSQSARGIELLRLAVPARKYLQGHLDDVAEALLYASANRFEIKGLRRIEDSNRGKYDPAYFVPL